MCNKPLENDFFNKTTRFWNGFSYVWGGALLLWLNTMTYILLRFIANFCLIKPWMKTQKIFINQFQKLILKVAKNESGQAIFVGFKWSSPLISKSNYFKSVLTKGITPHQLFIQVLTACGRLFIWFFSFVQDFCKLAIWCHFHY